MSIHVRSAERAEVDRIARIWHDAWRDSHLQLLPAELARLRTLESFRERIAGALADVRVADLDGEPAGICLVKGDELHQLFVLARARGTGAAAALLADAEARMREAGVEVAWLACAIGNDRAARFYEKCGWRRAGVMVNMAETSEGPFPVETWRYEKALGREN